MHLAEKNLLLWISVYHNHSHLFNTFFAEPVRKKQEASKINHRPSLVCDLFGANSVPRLFSGSQAQGKARSAPFFFLFAPAAALLRLPVIIFCWNYKFWRSHVPRSYLVLFKADHEQSVAVDIKQLLRRNLRKCSLSHHFIFRVDIK